MKAPIAIAILLSLAASSLAQTGSFRISFTPDNGGSTVSMQINAPLLAFDNSHGYWFIHPLNGRRHLQYSPEMYWADKQPAAAFITINDSRNDFDVFDISSDSNAVSTQNNDYAITAPPFNIQNGDKNKGLHVHINSFTASECSFIISGQAVLHDNKKGTRTSGKVTGSAHFYRDARYEKSDLLPGCNCDPAIYATINDVENNVRTASGCENALRNKIFEAVQKATAPLFDNIAYKGTGQLSAGDIDISILPGNINIKLPPRQPDWCASDGIHNWLVPVLAHKKIFTSDDNYGLRFIRMPAALVNMNSAEQRRKQAAFTDSAMKLMMNGKMTKEQFIKAENEMTGNGISGADIKQMEMENNLTVKILFNPADIYMTPAKLNGKDNIILQHNIKGAAYETFCAASKDGDGNWTGNKLFIFLGKFQNPVSGRSGTGNEAAIVRATYPVNANKLSVFSIAIEIQGGKEMLDKARQNINYSALQSLITLQ